MDVYVSIRFKFQRNLGQSPLKTEEGKWRKEQGNENKKTGGFRRNDRREEMKR